MSIRSYHDYHSFLRDHTQMSRASNPRWSYGSWARKLGLKSKSTLIMTLQGKRKLSPKLMQKMIQYFKFNADDESYFRRLVSIDAKEKTVVHQVKIDEKVQADKPLPPGSEGVFLKAGWLAYVIKEAAAALGEKATAEGIAGSISTKPSKELVGQLLRCLVELGYLDEKNTPSTQSPQLNWTKEAVEKLHHDGLQAAEQAVKTLGPDERVFQTSFVRVRKERLAEARILLRSFQREFMREMEEEGGDEIVQLNLHLFSVATGLKS